ncbi:MAG: DUF4197 domain-containing protein [Pseudomonadales bacterium]
MKATRQFIVISLCVISFSSSQAIAESWWDKAKSVLGSSSSSSNESSDSATTAAALSLGDISSGLKEALQVGTGNVVSQLGAKGGFGLDDAIRIGLPDELETARKYLDKVGMGDSLSALEDKMNEAAELATPHAKTLFVDAISAMTIDDAKSIYKGSDTAATEYFREKMGGKLGDLIRPFVSESLSEAGAVQSFDKIMSNYKNIPFVPDVKADLTEHTVDKGLDGIFHYLAEEEAAIRANPKKRTTDLLKKVFSK